MMNNKTDLFLMFIITLAMAKLFFTERPTTFETLTVLMLGLLISLAFRRKVGV